MRAVAALAQLPHHYRSFYASRLLGRIERKLVSSSNTLETS